MRKRRSCYPLAGGGLAVGAAVCDRSWCTLGLNRQEHFAPGRRNPETRCDDATCQCPVRDGGDLQRELDAIARSLNTRPRHPRVDEAISGVRRSRCVDRLRTQPTMGCELVASTGQIWWRIRRPSAGVLGTHRMVSRKNVAMDPSPRNDPQ